MLRELGRTGLRVFPVGLGAMPLSVQGRPEEGRALETLRAALEAGVTFIDTADVYCLDERDIGHNERLIAQALEGRGMDTAVVATKGGLLRPRGDWVRDARPATLRASCERSLKALRRDAITLYQLHAPDPAVPFADSVGELARLKQEGKILHVGLSNVTIDELADAQRVVRIESVQNRCHPLDARDYSGGMLAACEAQGVSYLPYGTVGGYRQSARIGEQPRLNEIAQRYGATPYAVTVAWHLAKSPRVIPIPGASRTESIRDSAGAARLRLEPSDLAAIDALAR